MGESGKSFRQMKGQVFRLISGYLWIISICVLETVAVWKIICLSGNTGHQQVILDSKICQYSRVGDWLFGLFLFHLVRKAKIWTNTVATRHVPWQKIKVQDPQGPVSSIHFRILGSQGSASSIHFRILGSQGSASSIHFRILGSQGPAWSIHFRILGSQGLMPSIHFRILGSQGPMTSITFRIQSPQGPTT